MSDERTPREADLRSPKRARTIPLAHCEGADMSDDTNRQLDRRSTTLKLEGKFSPSEARPRANLEKQERSGSIVSAESSLSPQDPESLADKNGVEASCPENDLPKASREDKEAIVPSPGESPTSQTSIKGPPLGETDPLVLQRSSSPGGDHSEAQATVPFADESTSQNERLGSVSSSTQDSDSVHEHAADSDADDIGAPSANFRRPVLSLHELLALPVPPKELSLEEELGPWSAPPEPLRPPNPFKKGQNLTIRKHKACAPFGMDYADYPGLREEVSARDLRTKTLVELCLEHPPMEGETALGDAPRSLHIIDEIRVKEDGGAQLVVCRLDDGPDEYVGKIYDPLYYGFSDRMWSDVPRDVTTEADRDYCREVAAYLELDEPFGGKETPKYYGSWTFCLPIDLPDDRKVRDVRMILMERVNGGTMSDMDPPPYPEEVRLEALAQTLEAFNRIHCAGVIHRDIAQRNVMICDGKTASTIERVVIIDFNFAVVSRLAEWVGPSGGSRRQRLPEKPRNPIDDWWDCGGLYSEFGDWLPASWDRLYKPMREWLYARWGKSNEFLPHKEPLIWDYGED